MMKKTSKSILCTILLLLVFGVVTVCGATEEPQKKKVAVIVLIDSHGVSKPNDVINGIYENVHKKLEGHNIEIVPIEESRQVARNYARENQMTVMKKADLAAIATETGADFGIYVQAKVSNVQAKSGFLKASIHKTITCEFRILDIAADKYKIDISFDDEGKSTAGPYGGMPSSDRAYMRAVDGALEQLTIDPLFFE
jgi:hypothetical protein